MASWNPGNGYTRNQEADVLHGQQQGWANKDKYAAPGIGKSRAKRNICIALLCLVVVLVVVLAIAIPVAVNNAKNKDKKANDNDGDSKPLTSLKVACAATLYPDVCYESLSSYVNDSDSVLPQKLVKYAITAAREGVLEELSEVKALLANTTGPVSDNATIQAVANDCISFLEDATDSLNDTMDEYQDFSLANAKQDLADIQTWVSAALTYEETCLDGFKDLNLGPTNDGLDEFLQHGNYASKLLSNVLALLVTLKDATSSIPKFPGTRRLLSDDHGPSTLHVKLLRRRLLQASNPTPNVTVALDGTGTYKKIQDAVNQAPVLDKDGTERYVIYVKAGKYTEQVLIPKTANNVMLIGDGTNKTIISGSLSVIGNNMTTSLTATLTVQGKNFVGRNFTVENTAGAANHQAVAIRATGDYGAFQNCEFLGFQDTLYAHTNRQFYTGCSVTGTVDFIFGNAAAVFQNCKIIAAKGLLGQQNTYTASGRTDPNQNTGLIFQQCTFAATTDLANTVNGTFLTYLGRPWKDYARTVVMRSYETGKLDPTGWLLWNGNSTNAKTVYYGEYLNNGPGFVPSSRVSWSKQISLSQAQGFSANSFVQASDWLPQNSLSYFPSV